MTPTESRLEAGATSVTIAPHDGGRISSLVIDGDELLITEPRDDPIAWGCYPMVPWAGRLREGTLHFDATSYELPVDHPPHAIHGTGYTHSWRTVEAGRLALALASPWPFGGRVVHDLELTSERLRCQLTVTAGEQRMPAMVGWHPWFRRSLSAGSRAVLHLEAGQMWQRGADGIPTGHLVAPASGPWDDCFTDLRSDPRIEWPGVREIRLSSTCQHWVVYDEQEHALCVEPQSGPPNQLNRDPVVLEPHESLRARFELAWREISR